MKQTQPKSDRYFTAFLWVVFGVLGRLLPHPPNVTPLTSIALFGGSQLSRRSAFLVTMLTLLLSDALLALATGHAVFGLWSIFTYSGFAAIVLAGMWLRLQPTAGRTLGFLGASSLGFWLWTNFGVWATNDHQLYPRTLEGLGACYIAALPFLGNALVGDLCWGLAMFLSFAALRKISPRFGLQIQGA